MGITPVAGSVPTTTVNQASDSGSPVGQTEQAKFTMHDSSGVQSVKDMIQMAEAATVHPSLDVVAQLDARDPFASLTASKAEFHEYCDRFSAAAIERGDTRLAESMKLMALMSDVQSATLGVECFSKCVEHAVSGTKTVLATQT